MRLVVTFAFMASGVILGISSASAARIHLVGNSLTWDTRPSILDGDVTWSIYSGHNLPYFYDNPDGYDSNISTSIRWPDALDETIEVLVVRPHRQSTLPEDLAVIEQFADRASNAEIIIHTGWDFRDRHVASYYGGLPDDSTVHSPEYFDTLASQVAASTGRSVRINPAIDALERIRLDIEAGGAPFLAFADLYRDSQHMAYQPGPARIAA